MSGLTSGLTAAAAAAPASPDPPAGVATGSSLTDMGSSLTGPNEGSPFSPGMSSPLPLPIDRKSGLQSTSILPPPPLPDEEESSIDLGPPEESRFSMDFLPCWAGVGAADPSGVDRVSDRSWSGLQSSGTESSVARIWSGSWCEGGGNTLPVEDTGVVPPPPPSGVGGWDPPSVVGTDWALGGCCGGGACCWGWGVEAWGSIGGPPPRGPPKDCTCCCCCCWDCCWCWLPGPPTDVELSWDCSIWDICTEAPEFALPESWT
uniref:Putative secreted protein n=1 Tax=Ixodes ricinus TaxID=34613 RepID=A0A6B0V6J5_IXORI